MGNQINLQFSPNKSKEPTELDNTTSLVCDINVWDFVKDQTATSQCSPLLLDSSRSYVILVFVGKNFKLEKQDDEVLREYMQVLAAHIEKVQTGSFSKNLCDALWKKQARRDRLEGPLRCGLFVWDGKNASTVTKYAALSKGLEVQGDLNKHGVANVWKYMRPGQSISASMPSFKKKGPAFADAIRQPSLQAHPFLWLLFGPEIASRSPTQQVPFRRSSSPFSRPTQQRKGSLPPRETLVRVIEGSSKSSNSRSSLSSPSPQPTTRRTSVSIDQPPHTNSPPLLFPRKRCSSLPSESNDLPNKRKKPSKENLALKQVTPRFLSSSSIEQKLERRSMSGSSPSGLWFAANHSPEPSTPRGLSRESLGQMVSVAFKLSLPDKEEALCIEPSEKEKKAKKLAVFAPLCSKVAEGLHVSGGAVAANRELLLSHGITHVINCALEIPNHFQDDFEYLNFALSDNTRTDITCCFYEAIEFIQNAVSSGGAVLVHCHQGVSRSCTIAIAYLMWKNNWDYDQGCNVVRQGRGICSPNAGFMCQLLEWGKNRMRHFERPILYMCAALHPTRPDRLTIRRVDGLSTSLLDPRGVFVLHEVSRVFIWKGSLSTPALFKAACECVARLQAIEELDGRVVHCTEREESAEFLEVMGGLQGPITTVALFDETFRELGIYLPNERPPSPVPLIGVRSDPDPENTPRRRGDDEDVVTAPALYAYPSFDAISMFDSDDLEEDGVFVLWTHDVQNTVYVFFGEDVELEDLGCGSTEVEVARAVAEQYRVGLAAADPIQVVVVHWDVEDDAFWDCFSNG